MQTDGKNIKADGKKKYDEEAENMVAGVWVCVCALLFIASFLHCFYQWKEEGGGGGRESSRSTAKSKTERDVLTSH